MAHGESYEEFVAKFKQGHKKTTDDCYTPQPIYEIIKEWAVSEYNLQDFEIVRPFYPGGDYQKYNYLPNQVVIDNPPFSILAEIKRFYVEHNVKFFLFAPHLTLFTTLLPKLSYIIVNVQIIYENGAKVATSFVTNLERGYIFNAPEIKTKIQETQYEKRKNKSTKKYPPHILTSTTLENVNFKFRIKIDECEYIRRLDDQKQSKKAIFGNGFLVNDRVAEIIRKRQEEIYTNKTEYWELSEREKEIIKKLNEREKIK